MKKILLSFFTLAAAGSFAQTANFDNLTLGTESYYDGSDLAGEFLSGGAAFRNEYDTSFGGYWSGAFIYSNTTNQTDGTYANGQSAFLATPSATGNIYSVYYSSYNGAAVDFGSEVNPVSAKLTNSTFSAISMRDGDAFGKQFGSPNNAQGNPDGTNGEDFFVVHIIGLDGDSLAVDTVDFYLADYRFSNSAQDYIIDSWTNVSLSALAGSRYLAFEFESSDNGQFGMNTPAYFAMDDLMYAPELGLKELDSQLSVYPNPALSTVNIHSEAGELTITDAAGKIVLHDQTSGQYAVAGESWPAGFYTIQVKSEFAVGRQQLIKR